MWRRPIWLVVVIFVGLPYIFGKALVAVSNCLLVAIPWLMDRSYSKGLGPSPTLYTMTFTMNRVVVDLRRVSELVVDMYGTTIRDINGWVGTKKGSVQPAPGWKLHRLAAFIYSRKTFERVFEPTLRDMQDEHVEALADGRRWKALWVVVRGYGSFWSAAIAFVPISIAKRVHAFWKTIA